jgi:hypothetical protein
MDERKNPPDTPANEARVPQISAPPPVAPSYSDFDAHHYDRYEQRSRVTSRSSNQNDCWTENLELDEVRSPRPSSISTASISSGECRTVRSFRVITQASTIRPGDGPFRMLRKFWLRNVVLTVPHNKNRDHFGKPFPNLFHFILVAFAFLYCSRFRLDEHSFWIFSLVYFFSLVVRRSSC